MTDTPKLPPDSPPYDYSGIHDDDDGIVERAVKMMRGAIPDPIEEAIEMLRREKAA